jgi:hypothetical protein
MRVLVGFHATLAPPAGWPGRKDSVAWLSMLSHVAGNDGQSSDTNTEQTRPSHAWTSGEEGRQEPERPKAGNETMHRASYPIVRVLVARGNWDWAPGT